jgi:hypothetical protein
MCGWMLSGTRTIVPLGRQELGRSYFADALLLRGAFGRNQDHKEDLRIKMVKYRSNIGLPW